MTIEKIRNEEALIVLLSGNLDSTTAGDLEAKVLNDLEDIHNLTLDFKELGFISSKGIRVVLQINKKMANKGSFKIINCNSAVTEVFRISGLMKILNIE